MAMTKRVTLGHLLRQVRERTGYSQQDLAFMLGKAQSTISAWEADDPRRKPNADEVVAFLMVCDATDGEWQAYRHLRIPDARRLAARKRSVQQRKGHGSPSRSAAPQTPGEAGNLSDGTMPGLLDRQTLTPVAA